MSSVTESHEHGSVVMIDVEIESSEQYFVVESVDPDVYLSLKNGSFTMTADVFVRVKEVSRNEELLLLGRVENQDVLNGVKIDGDRFSIYQHHIEDDVIYHEMSELLESEFLPNFEIKFGVRIED